MRLMLGGSGGGASSVGGGFSFNRNVPYSNGEDTCSPDGDCGGGGTGACTTGKVGDVPQAGPQTGACPGSAPVLPFPPCPYYTVDNITIGSVPVDQM